MQEKKSDCSANKHESNNSTAILALEHRNDVFYAVRAVVLYQDELVETDNYKMVITVRIKLKKEKKIYGREPQEAWHQDELIGGKPTVAK
jgi:hypothetical protein